jgi:hypothetical protein
VFLAATHLLIRVNDKKKVKDRNLVTPKKTKKRFSFYFGSTGMKHRLNVKN